MTRRLFIAIIRALATALEGDFGFAVFRRTRADGSRYMGEECIDLALIQPAHEG